MHARPGTCARLPAGARRRGPTAPQATSAATDPLASRTCAARGTTARGPAWPASQCEPAAASAGRRCGSPSGRWAIKAGPSQNCAHGRAALPDTQAALLRVPTPLRPSAPRRCKEAGQACRPAVDCCGTDPSFVDTLTCEDREDGAGFKARLPGRRPVVRQAEHAGWHASGHGPAHLPSWHRGAPPGHPPAVPVPGGLHAARPALHHGRRFRALLRLTRLPRRVRLGRGCRQGVPAHVSAAGPASEQTAPPAAAAPCCAAISPAAAGRSPGTSIPGCQRYPLSSASPTPALPPRRCSSFGEACGAAAPASSGCCDLVNACVDNGDGLKCQ